MAHPGVRWPDTLGHIRFLHNYPYFLPCVTAGGISFISFLYAYHFLKEVSYILTPDSPLRLTIRYRVCPRRSCVSISLCRTTQMPVFLILTSLSPHTERDKAIQNLATMRLLHEYPISHHRFYHFFLETLRLVSSTMASIVFSIRVTPSYFPSCCRLLSNMEAWVLDLLLSVWLWESGVYPTRSFSL